MTHRRMKWIIVSEIVVIIVLIILAVSIPQFKPFILPVVLIVGTIQIFFITPNIKKNNRK